MNKTILIGIAAAAAVLIGVAVYIMSGSEQTPPPKKAVLNLPIKKTVENGEQAPPPPEPLPVVIPKEQPQADVKEQKAESQPEDVPAPEEAEVQPAPQEDGIVPVSFIDELAKYVVSRYLPPNTRRNPGEKALFHVGWKKVNMRFGLQPEVFNVDHGPLASMRRQVLNYVFTPQTITRLSELYTTPFVNQLVYETDTQTRQYLTSDGYAPRRMSREEKKELLGIVAEKVNACASIFHVIARKPEILDSIHDYLQSVEAANKAHAAFWDKDSMDSQKAELAGKKVKQAIDKRESLKSSIIRNIRGNAEKLTGNDDEVLYLTLWAYRRSTDLNESPERLRAAADALITLSREIAQANNG